MSKKIVTVQDISCYGGCSTTVALPIISHYGIECAILPSAILSTHTSGFKNFTVLDLTDEMPKIINHWIDENIKFDAIYTGYIGDVRQFDLILKMKDKLLKENGLFIVDPAMADNGKMYPALKEDIQIGMRKIVRVADYVIPNITEACFLTNTEYKEEFTMAEYQELVSKLYQMGAKNVILTGIRDYDSIGAMGFDGITRCTIFKEYRTKCYHGTGDIFSSIIVSDIVNGKPLKDAIDHACEFVGVAIDNTMDDDSHPYGVKFEEILESELKSHKDILEEDENTISLDPSLEKRIED